ncbi:guanine nucleotide binding protein, alpha subunit [Crepidotus variabilis]|uniref:Guanine nucleotide binding protein, alpha subunit n=1 Tax=Crepidotus variabilis TaxID=179855 RepID=A0A9P6JQE1_9AGAR|nr:guanine nucleotide binding protein, alpha subunit [Crepidotus variabilis]
MLHMFRHRRFTVDILDKDADPLAKAIEPPPTETPEERASRLAREAEAQRRSDAIDEEINRQKQEMKKAPKPVRVLLLGQSESGKSTTLKNFQLMNSPKAFRHERASWRAVVQLNIVRSVRLILETLTEAYEGSSTPTPSSPIEARVPSPTPTAITAELLRLRMRLLPLQQVEEVLLRKLTPAGSAEFEATHLSPINGTPYRTFRGSSTQISGNGKFKEITINSTAQWKIAFGKLVAAARDSFDSAADIDFEDPNDPGVVLNACADDIVRLWHDKTVRQLLEAQRLRLEDMSGFFLDSVERITALRYVPTDDDILRARLKTVGVSEHKFTLRAGNVLSHDWRVFDVGGARSLRAAWAPYFDDLDAIIFLAPISGFDEALAEDPTINKLEDSILLWKHLVSNPLLKNTQMVLFLNKIDILKAKLRARIRFCDFVVSYGTRPNDYDSIANYLKKKFGSLYKQTHQGDARVFYCHCTVMTDAQTTQSILINVKDMVLRQNLVASSLV